MVVRGLGECSQWYLHLEEESYALSLRGMLIERNENIMKKKKLKKIPKFRNEDEEREFWATHDTTEYVDATNAVRVSLPNLKPSTVLTSIRLPAWLMSSLKRIANEKDIPTQSLMKLYLSEKVKEEMRSLSR